MVKIKLIQLRRPLRNYRISIAAVLLALLVCVAALAVAWMNAEKSIEASEKAYRSTSENTKKLLAQLEAKKNAQREAEEAKEAAEAEEAAKAAAAAQLETEKPAGSNATGSCNTASTHNNPASIDVVINKKHCLVPQSFTPPDLMTSNGATLSAKAMGSFNQMFAAASAAGQPFTVSSSYRSYATQVSTYNYWVSVNGQAGADTVSARPGFSEHQTGFVIDVGANGCILDCFGGTSEYQWFQANAANYGFIQRYYAGQESITGYASEEWHYRYVGAAVALDMKARGIKTLEQYWGVEGGNYN